MNSSKCTENENMKGLVCLVLWTFQEDAIRSSYLARQEPLEKATLSFKPSLHNDGFSFFSNAQDVFQRCHSGIRDAVTFAEGSN
jgi:hypothetical protein